MYFNHHIHIYNIYILYIAHYIDVSRRICDRDHIQFVAKARDSRCCQLPCPRSTPHNTDYIFTRSAIIVNDMRNCVYIERTHSTCVFVEGADIQLEMGFRVSLSLSLGEYEYK